MSIVKTCYDKILPRELNRPQRMMAFGDRQRAIFVFRKMWITGSTGIDKLTLFNGLT